ncbi:uncharacterized protein LOC123292049 [Chrysoperla carnea]|uniref:uncharacterized protein LOC123292049 n=1 Tax=Chrysoperla carnea TaxID=189513 RepID=UPI001D096572|nr:uncharacterized protein LOC123292049 [Chrysoperla carnea]
MKLFVYFLVGVSFNFINLNLFGNCNLQTSLYDQGNVFSRANVKTRSPHIHKINELQNALNPIGLSKNSPSKHKINNVIIKNAKFKKSHTTKLSGRHPLKRKSLSSKHSTVKGPYRKSILHKFRTAPWHLRQLKQYLQKKANNLFYPKSLEENTKLPYRRKLPPKHFRYPSTPSKKLKRINRLLAAYGIPNTHRNRGKILKSSKHKRSRPLKYKYSKNRRSYQPLNTRGQTFLIQGREPLRPDDPDSSEENKPPTKDLIIDTSHMPLSPAQKWHNIFHTPNPHWGIPPPPHKPNNLHFDHPHAHSYKDIHVPYSYGMPYLKLKSINQPQLPHMYLPHYQLW